MSSNELLIMQNINLLLQETEEAYIFRINQIKKIYRDMSKEERDSLIEHLHDIFLGCESVLFVVLTIFVDCVDCSRMLFNEMTETILKSDFTIEELMRAFIQLRYVAFSSPEVDPSSISKLYRYIYKRCLAECYQCQKYIPYAKRDVRKILVITDQLLAETHSPTQLLCNLVYFLRKAGYGVEVLVASEAMILPDERNWLSKGKKMNNRFENDESFNCMYYGENIKGYNFNIRAENLTDSITEAISVVRRVNPVFAISMDTNLIADIVSDFMTVICNPLMAGRPASIVKRVIYKGERTDTIGLDWNKDGEKDIYAINYPIILSPQWEGDESVIQEIRSISGFKALLVGNRLDDEIDHAFINFLYDCVHRIDDIVYVIVGDCPKLKEYIMRGGLKDHFFFVGYTKNLPGIMNCVNVYLNPPRKGGGFSAKIAMESGVPIITLRNCDVYEWCGEEFACDDFAEMGNLLMRYQDDEMYEKQQKEILKKNCLSFFVSEADGIKNTIDGCKSIIQSICREEIR